MPAPGLRPELRRDRRTRRDRASDPPSACTRPSCRVACAATAIVVGQPPLGDGSTACACFSATADGSQRIGASNRPRRRARAARTPPCRGRASDVPPPAATCSAPLAARSAGDRSSVASRLQSRRRARRAAASVGARRRWRSPPHWHRGQRRLEMRAAAGQQVGLRPAAPPRSDAGPNAPDAAPFTPPCPCRSRSRSASRRPPGLLGRPRSTTTQLARRAPARAAVAPACPARPSDAVASRPAGATRPACRPSVEPGCWNRSSDRRGRSSSKPDRAVRRAHRPQPQPGRPRHAARHDLAAPATATARPRRRPRSSRPPARPRGRRSWTSCSDELQAAPGAVVEPAPGDAGRADGAAGSARCPGMPRRLDPARQPGHVERALRQPPGQPRRAEHGKPSSTSSSHSSPGSSRAGQAAAPRRRPSVDGSRLLRTRWRR